MTSRLSVFVVDAFTDAPFSGNPAAVCLVDADQDLSDATMLNIAAEMNLSETAFVRICNRADSFVNSCRFGLRWFTPSVEVPLCGHATLASATVLFRCIGNKSPAITFNTLSGPLTASADGEFVCMDMPLNMPYKVEGSELQELDNLVKMIVGELDVYEVCYSPTTRKLLVRLDDTVGLSMRDLESLKPNVEPLPSLYSSGKVRGVIVTVLTSHNDKYDFASRYFAPWVGINEDPVTGSAHTVLAPYWSNVLNKTNLCARQCSKRGGDLRLTVRHDENRTEVAGRAVVVVEGSLAF